jgi:FkbH-like protein
MCFVAQARLKRDFTQWVGLARSVYTQRAMSISPTTNGEQRLVISATFTAEPVEDALSYWLKLLGRPLAPAFAAYNQVFQELYAPDSLLASNNSGVNVLLLRLADFARGRTEKDSEALKTLFARTVSELTAAIAAFAQKSRVPLVVAVLPASPEATRGWSSAALRMEDELVANLRDIDKLNLIERSEIERYAEEPGFDQVQDELGHIPYTGEYFAAIASAIARRVHCLNVPARKVLVLDCDNTLWRGVVAEDGVDGIELTPGSLALQRFAVEEHERGTLICLASKNVERDVFDVFERRRDMVLQANHLVAHRINWQSKFLNLQELARELDLGLDSFVMIDDSSVECAELRSAVPQVLTLQLPREDEVASFVQHVWAFDRAKVTDVDKRRTELYRENAQRTRFELATTSVADFIRGLELVIQIAPPKEAEWARLSQLTQRTNQFNCTTRRCSEAELRALAGTGHDCLAVHVSDRFGDYGLVGLIVFGTRGDRLVVDNLLLSCRVLGRGVEHAMLRTLGRVARERGLSGVSLAFSATERNLPARVFVESVGTLVDTDQGPEYRVSIEDAEHAEYAPGEKRGDRETLPPEPQTLAPALLNRERAALPYEKIATSLCSASAVRRAALQGRARRRPLEGSAAPASTVLERDLVKIWEELLEVEGLGVEDDFFELGGTSLLAVALLARVAADFDRRMPFSTIMEAPTIRALASRIENKGNRENPLTALRASGSTRLFLVHDGEGETLLYRGLARRLPPDIGVFGLMPKTLDGIPLAHTSVEAMAAHYLAAIRSVQPRGPYYLGGLCVGGTIAFEIAAQLESAGETVALVALFDAASPTAARKQGLVSKRRLGHARDLFHKAREGGSLQDRLGVLRDVVRRAANVATYEVGSRFQNLSSTARLRLLEAVLKRGRSWPSWVPSLGFRGVVESAERAYAPNKIRHARVVLYRALEDTQPSAFRYQFEDADLGWGRHAGGGLEIVDVPGNHSSMLQEPNVDALAASVTELMGDGAASVRSDLNIPIAAPEDEFRRTA